MPADTTVDFVVMFLVLGLVALGLLSVLVGKVVAWWDRFMSSQPSPFPVPPPRIVGHRPDAAEQGRDTAEHTPGTLIPSMVAAWEQIDDDTRLDILAQVRDSEGEWLYAESRIARFIGGRVEDRIGQVRAARGIEPPPAPERLLKVRDAAGERVIPY